MVILVWILFMLSLCIVVMICSSVVFGRVSGCEKIRMLLWKVISVGIDWILVAVVSACLVFVLILLNMTLGWFLDVCLKMGANMWYGLHYVV